MSRDWIKWHADYADADSDLAHRLQVVRDELSRLLTGHARRLVSVCSGSGDDVLPVLASTPQSADVESFLIENHPQIAAKARHEAAALGLDHVRVLERDAGQASTYIDIPRADILLLCGVFGNIGDDDIRVTIEAVPGLLNRGGHVLWTRSRRAPDVTPGIRRQLNALGFVDLAFVAPDDELWSVGVHRFEGETTALDPDATMFTFIV